MLTIRNIKRLVYLQKDYSSSITTAVSHQQNDALQQKALKENCILVDENDNSLGPLSKEECHRVDQKSGDLKLHRAFSVFLFNLKGDMLIQKRSKHKVTFPSTYTNACCSHPLYDIESECEERNAIGIKKAAQRRLNYELGIPYDQVRPDHLHYLTRIHYFNKGDGIWGEHEIDYILFLQKNVDLTPNANEVSEVQYVKRSDLDTFISNLKSPLTPWFKLILENRLKLWWDNLHQLKKFENIKAIQKFDESPTKVS